VTDYPISCRADWFLLVTRWNNPATYLRYMADDNRLPPELEALRGCRQDPVWHPEGSALEHTCQVVDRMADICTREGAVEDVRVVLMLAAVCHDFGKATTTVFNEQKGKWTSYGHDVAGLPIAQKFLEDIQAGPDVIVRVLPLVRWHMTHCRKEFTEKAVRKLAREIQPATLRQLLLLMEADCMGRGMASSGLPQPVLTQLVPIAEANGWLDGPHRADRRSRPSAGIGLAETKGDIVPNNIPSEATPGPAGV
jgi:tRNA nucleotidyltransferase (CCA-adding enzyme)